uniref:Uncharacterized protein n=2 Tax=Cannabis sativa TaxID=3483 RepID=A0A803QUJ2_CANSA
MTSTTAILRATRHHLQLPTLMNGNGNSAFYYAMKRNKRLFPEIREIEETMSRYLILPKGWDFIVNFMAKWWLPARFLFLITGQIWMTSGHKGR